MQLSREDVKAYSYEDLLHVQFIIDEFANIGRIPNFNEVLASVRSREMSIKIILQAINQLKALYKDDWKTILNNCANSALSRYQWWRYYEVFFNACR